jgi:uncharacterized small protein (TIGR04563 family)
MGSFEKQKQSLYFPEDTLREIMKEANRLDRSLSWTVQQAWRIAREHVRHFPSVDRPREAAAVRPVNSAAPAPRRAEREERERGPSAQVLEFLKGKFDRELSG